MGMNLFNLDLLSVGITVAATLILGASVYFTDPKSLTNRMFLWFSIVTACWGTVNFLSYQFSDHTLTLWLLRSIMFFAILQAFFLYEFFAAFPARERVFSVMHNWFLVPAVFIAAITTLTPLVFSGFTGTVTAGEVAITETGPGIFLFGIVAVGLVIAALRTLFIKFRRAEGGARRGIVTIFIGTVITFALIILFNLVFATVFSNPRFVPLGALFMFPFVVFASFAILHDRLFNVKVAATSLLVFILAIVSLGEMIFSTTSLQVFFRTGIFILVLVFGISLIRGVIREIKLREEVEELATNLSTANDKLKELDRLKSQFLSMASHDLRAPLTIIRNFISLLLDGSYGALAPAGQEGLKQVFDRATDMAKSVETYLDVSRIEQGRMKYDFVDIELTPLIKNAVMAFTPNAEKKGLKLSATYDTTLDGVKAKIDVSKMNEVLNNLLDNTIKYTPTGEMNLSVKRIGTVARISLKDTGVGMTEDTLKNLFQLFRPGEDSKRINPASTGVGLFVTKAHVEAHKGKIWAESEGAGKGSTFIIELPFLS